MTERCKIHPTVNLVKFCPTCRGGGTSPEKARAARRNGKKGGRPKKVSDG